MRRWRRNYETAFVGDVILNAAMLDGLFMVFPFWFKVFGTCKKAFGVSERKDFYPGWFYNE